MRKAAILLIAAGLVLLGAGGVMGKHHEVKIKEKAGIGKYFTDTEGMTLYWFKRDSRGQSACSGSCVEKWPLYYREKVAPPAGIKGSEFGTITREDGKKQTTFRRYPLYYWSGDKKAGDTGGQGINDAWYVVNPDKFPPK